MVESNNIRAEVRRTVLLEACHSCTVQTCAEPGTELHHIKARQDGGTSTPENLVALCQEHYKMAQDGQLVTASIMADKDSLKQLAPSAAGMQAKQTEAQGQAEQTQGIIPENEQLKLRTAVLDLRSKAAEPAESRPAILSRLASVTEANSLFEAGVRCCQQEEFTKALEHWEACRAIEDTFAVQQNLGAVYDYLGRLDDALKAYVEFEKMRNAQGLPGDAGVAANRGDLCQELGRHEDALAAYDRAEGLRRDQGLAADWSLAMNRGVAFRNLGQNDDALKAYGLAEKLLSGQGLPADARLAVNRGVAYWNLAMYEHALNAYDRAAAIRSEQGLPVDPILTFNRAHVFKAQGNLDMACTLARQAQDEYEEHMPQTPVHPAILNFIAINCDG